MANDILAAIVASLDIDTECFLTTHKSANHVDIVLDNSDNFDIGQRSVHSMDLPRMSDYVKKHVITVNYTSRSPIVVIIFYLYGISSEIPFTPSFCYSANDDQVYHYAAITFSLFDNELLDNIKLLANIIKLDRMRLKLAETWDYFLR